MNKLIYIPILLFVALALCVPNAWARLEGEVEWGYAHFEQTSDNQEDKTASHFTQRYSLLYSMEGLIANGLGGYYDLGIGAEWGAFDTDIENGNDSETIDNDAFKLLYQGSLQIAPGGLPFRLTAYSYDNDRILFERDSGRYYFDALGGTPGQQNNSFGLMNPRIVTDLHNGQTIVSGVQFMAGIRNGSYLGKYRELLSQWPRILVDYRDVYRKDTKSFTEEEYRDRNLAFVSLNKKDNWFHYRLFSHTDYIYKNRDTEETTIMLGTIDHTLKRQWIDLTNWIRISVDGSFTRFERDQDDYDEKRFDVNFFTTMQRRDFNASSFVTMQREQRGGYLEQTLDAPVFVNNSLNPDTSVHSTFQLWKNKEILDSRNYDRDEGAYYAKVQLDARKRSRVQVSPSIEMEVHTGDMGDGNGVRGKVEAHSNALRRQDVSWYGMSALALFDGSSETNEKTDLWEGELQGGVSYDLRNNMRLGAEQYLLYGDGSYGQQVTRYMYSQAGRGFGRNENLSTEVMDGSIFRTITSLYFEHTSSSRMSNRFDLYYKFQDDDGVQLDTLELSHRLLYRSRLWNVKVENFYVTGDDNDYNGPGSGYLGRVVDANPFEHQFMHRSTVEFSPNRYWRSRLDGSVTWGKGFSGDTNLLFQFEQELERTFYDRGSVRRRRGDITQSLIYEQFKDGIDKRAIIFSLEGHYYPTTAWWVGARALYHDYDFQDNFLWLSLTTGVNYPLFSVDFSYDYGAQDNDNNTVAHRYEVNVRKTF